MPGAGMVTFDGVWKKFRTGERHDSLRDLIPSLFRRARPETLGQQEFWALEDVSFEVRAGEALGIIGPNGAGKSTTLKLLTKILKPSIGACQVNGRVGALIEVAAGFHQDLTGRENVFLQGAILGMRQAEVARRFDEIVAFAGVDAFIDTPVKRYSSGMNARLGFAIAVHLEPDVLIIDEVLSVGDMAFQQRCVERMREFKRQGAAIVFVSHNLSAVVDLCDRALYLKRSVQGLGPTADVIERYVASQSGDGAAEAPDGAEIQLVTLTDPAGRRVDRVAPGTELVLSVTYRLPAATPGLTLGLVLFRSTDKLVVYDAHFTPEEMGVDVEGRDEGGSEPDGWTTVTVDYRIRANLTRGQYHFYCFVNQAGRYLHRVSPAAHLSVQEQRTYSGVADLSVRPEARGVPSGVGR